MFNNYIKIAFRNLWKNRQYSFINIIGLSVGIAAVALIMVYLMFELSYDRFHLHGKNIYRINVEHNWDGKIVKFPDFVPAAGPALKKDFPQVEDYTRIRREVSEYFAVENELHRINKIRYVDSSFFDMFSFKIFAGDSNSALKAPYSIILTRSVAKKIWGTEDVIGKTLHTDNMKIFTVTAVAEDPPANSSIDFNALISFSTLYQYPGMFMGWDGGNQYTTYILLNEKTDIAGFEALMEGFIKKYMDQGYFKDKLFLEPFKQIHLFYEPGFLFLRILQFGAVALLSLIMGGANFINISLAQSVKRTKETGVRKVIGAGKRQIVIQFLIESSMVTITAAVIGISLVEVVFKNYSHILGQDLPRSVLYSPYFVIILLAVSLVVSISAGAVPAHYQASLSPAGILKNSFLTGHRKGRFRSVLIFVQFFISILLIIITLVVYRQQLYMKNKVLGFNKDNILVVNLPTDALKANNQLIKDALVNFTFVKNISLVSRIPYRGVTADGYLLGDENKLKVIRVIHTDEGFFDTFGISLSEGRNFSTDMETDKETCLVNESLVKMFEWKQPLGRTLTRNGIYTVVGVVKDFHFATLHEKIEPLLITNSRYTGYLGQLALRIDSEAISSGDAIRQIRDVISRIVPFAPFEYWFLDDAFDSLYRREEALSKIFIYSTALAVFIAFLGLYGLISIETEFRKKEIGIRRVLGCSFPGMILAFSRDVYRPVFFACLLVWPAAWYIANKWLQNFPYRIDLTILPFIISGLVMIFIVAVTVIIHVVHSAGLNPVDNLKSE